MIIRDKLPFVTRKEAEKAFQEALENDGKEDTGAQFRYRCQIKAIDLIYNQLQD